MVFINAEMRRIVDNVDLSWSKDLIIRYLTVNLAPFFRRDLLYFLADEEEQYRQYQMGFINRGRNIVCSTLADFYVELFKTFGINARKIAANSTRIPLFAVIVEGDKGWYFIDFLNDLFNNQLGIKTTEYGKIPRYNTLRTNFPYLVLLSDEYINDIDLALGIDKSLSSYFSELHLWMTDKNSIRKSFKVDDADRIGVFLKKMAYANENIINLGHINGAFERIRLYLFLEKIMFFKTEKRNISISLDKTYSIPRPVIEYTSPYQKGTVSFVEERTDGEFILARIK